MERMKRLKSGDVIKYQSEYYIVKGRRKVSSSFNVAKLCDPSIEPSVGDNNYAVYRDFEGERSGIVIIKPPYKEAFFKQVYSGLHINDKKLVWIN